MKTRAAARKMKRKAASGPASEQPANKLTSSKGKQVPGTPLDTDLEAHEVLHATAPSQKAMAPQPGSFGQHLLKGFAALWNDRSQSADVILSVGDQQIPAHSCVLCVWSEVFKALLTRWSAQRTGDGTKAAAVTVDLSHGDSPEDFLEVLHYCYMGMCRLDSHNVMPLLRLSNYYEILPLKETCGDFLFNLLTARRCLSLLLKLTVKYVCTRTWHMLIQHMAQNFEALLEEGALWQLPCTVWQEVLIQDCLAMPSERAYPSRELLNHLVKVANEAAVLSAVKRYVQLLKLGRLEDVALDMLLPCVRLPQLGLTTLLASIEQDTRLMSLDITKEYLLNAFKCLLLTKEGKAARPLAVAVAGSAAGSSSLVDSGAGGYEACLARMREVTMDLQDRPRRPPPSFTSPHPEGHNLGFLLERWRCTATAQAVGGLKKTYSLWDIQRPGRMDGPAPDAPRSCYMVVQPGLQSGSTYIELLIQSMAPSSKGKSGLRFWVVRDPRVKARSPPSDDSDASLVWDCCGTVYGRMATANAHGEDGIVQQMASSPLCDECIQQSLNICEGFSQGDIIGVGMRTTGLTTDGDSHKPPGPQTTEQSMMITFHKNGVLMGKQKLRSTGMAHRNPNGHWHVMVSSGTPGDSVQLLRPPPTQSAEPSTAHVPKAAQAAAQLDAESQAQRQSAAFEELMTAPAPHPQHHRDPEWTDEDEYSSLDEDSDEDM